MLRRGWRRLLRKGGRPFLAGVRGVNEVEVTVVRIGTLGSRGG